MMRDRAAWLKLKEENPKLAQAVVVNEIRLRADLSRARESMDLTQWQVAEKLGWSLKKVQEFEGIETPFTSKDLRRYQLAIGCFIRFEVLSDKALG